MSLRAAAAAVTTVGMTLLPRLLGPAVLLCSLASTAAVAQSSPVVEPKPAVSAEPVNDQAAQDRIMALVRAGKCGSAKTEATRVGDISLAEQIGTMCGARNADPFPTKSGAGRKGGAGGRRGGGG